VACVQLRVARHAMIVAAEVLDHAREADA